MTNWVSKLALTAASSMAVLVPSSTRTQPEPVPISSYSSADLHQMLDEIILHKINRIEELKIRKEAYLLSDDYKAISEKLEAGNELTFQEELRYDFFDGSIEDTKDNIKYFGEDYKKLLDIIDKDTLLKDDFVYALDFHIAIPNTKMEFQFQEAVLLKLADKFADSKASTALDAEECKTASETFNSSAKYLSYRYKAQESLDKDPAKKSR